LYGYVGGDPVNATDPMGLWSTDAHNQILRNLYGNCLSGSSLNQLMNGSLSVDGDTVYNALRNQTVGDPAEHAMRRWGESPEAAERRMMAFIDAQLRLARQFPADAFFYYGRALHPIMDNSSPQHEGFRPWPSLTPHGPLGEGVRHLTPERMRQTERSIRNYAPELNDLCKAY
jgi:hypothetical protein